MFCQSTPSNEYFLRADLELAGERRKNNAKSLIEIQYIKKTTYGITYNQNMKNRNKLKYIKMKLEC